MTTKQIFFTRHAQAYHNVAEDWTIPDAELTPLGREQSKQLNKDTKDTIQQQADLIVSSPLRRPLQTALDGYPSLITRLGGPSSILLLPELQECNDHPCDTGSPRSFLETLPEFNGIDLKQIDEGEKRHDGVDWTSKTEFWSADYRAILERAWWVRKWLRSRKEEKIVVVAHGDILRAITDGYRSDTPWANAEVKEYTFLSDDDEDAKVVPVKTEEDGEKPQDADETVAKEGEDEPTSSGK